MLVVFQLFFLAKSNSLFNLLEIPYKCSSRCWICGLISCEVKTFNCWTRYFCRQCYLHTYILKTYILFHFKSVSFLYIS